MGHPLYGSRLMREMGPVLGGTLSDANLGPGFDFSMPFWGAAAPPEGFLLQPGRVYLGSTQEVIGTDTYVPSLIGRSSLGRLGLFLQITADLGHLHVPQAPGRPLMILTGPKELYRDFEKPRELP
ncbi:dCTP deaminase domain-containing protein [Cystobacter ferrugineus]|uniref:Uncharacterized protein n=1 Tax=Cystobacter ferrugineus TaxID=83449 RepID=A0A1L9B0H3_9BACT|nr:hypothetical protein [Cystobacter ferrugineus]OJH35768.1 hypothetical protein BON30_37600 [Cystobacter ferrugineus]